MKISVEKESECLTCMGYMIRKYACLFNVCHSSAGREYYYKYLDTLTTAVNAIDSKISVRYAIDGDYITEFCYMYDNNGIPETFGIPWKVGK